MAATHPESLLEEVKVDANKPDVPYQSLMKVWLFEKVEGRHSQRCWCTTQETQIR